MGKYLKSFWKADNADVQMIGAVIGIFVTLLIAILLFYQLTAAIDMDTLDQDVGDALGHSGTGGGDHNYSGVSNATDDTMDQAATFFQVAPIIGIVVVAVVILGYVTRIGG